MESKTLAAVTKKKKKAPDNDNTDTSTQMETRFKTETEGQDGSLSSDEAAELPDSTYRGNVLTRSFFRLRGNRLTPPPSPSESSPLPKSEWELPLENE